MATVTVQQSCSSVPQPTGAPLIEIVECAMHAAPSDWLFFRELRVGTSKDLEMTKTIQSRQMS
jgi:hypothetical protein